MIIEKYSQIFKQYEKIIPMLDALIKEPLIIGIYTREECIFIRNAEKDGFTIPLKVGDKVSPKTVAYKAMQTDSILTNITPKEVFGVMMRTTATPIKNDHNEIIGCIAICTDLRRQGTLYEYSQNLIEPLNNTSNIMNNIANSVQTLVRDSSVIQEDIDYVKDQAKETDKILKMIEKISGQTNLLGLNALIESARAGETGRGFSVVAFEIQKLSEDTTSSVKDIKSILNTLKNKIHNIHDRFAHFNMNFEVQSSSLQEVTSMIEELSETSNRLKELTYKDITE